MNTSTVTNNNAETTAIESLFAKKLLRSKGIAVIPPSTGSGKTREIARFASNPKEYIDNVKSNKDKDNLHFSSKQALPRFY